MGRWQVVGVVFALALSAVAAVAQADYQAPQPGMPAVPGDSAQVYEDVLLLRTIRTLNLSPPQREELRKANARVLSEREDLKALREQMWEEYQDEIEDVLDAWMSYESPSDRDRSAADRAVNSVNEARAQLREVTWSAAESVYAALSDEQQDLVEGPGVAEARRARIARMGGTESAGEYVVAQFDAVRDLMPDEFEILAASEASRIARAIVGPNADTLQSTTDQVLDWLLEVYAWSPEQYRERREGLPAQVERTLGITPESQRPPVEFNDLVRLAGSDRTPIVLDEIARGGGEFE